MIDRKEHVVKHAHKLFIEKGYSDTSIQDILDESNISKGTFYNYFSSKNELLISIFESSYAKLEKMRNELLENNSPQNMDIFMEQLNLQFELSRENKLFLLFEEVSLSKNPDLKKCVKLTQLKDLYWYYQRLLHLFGDDKRDILLDCTVMFRGILFQNIKYHSIVNEINLDIEKVVLYCVNRLINMVEHLSLTKEQLLDPNLLNKWMDNEEGSTSQMKSIVVNAGYQLASNISKYTNTKQTKEELSDLLLFVIEEIKSNDIPRKYLIKSAFSSLKQFNLFEWNKEIEEFEQMIKSFIINE